MAFFGPRRNDGVLAGVGDGLAEMLAEVAGDHEEGAADGSVLAKQFLRVVEVGVFDGENGAAEMGERVLEDFQDFCFVTGDGVDGFGVDAGGRRSAERASDAVIGGGDVRVDFTDRADAFGGAPGIFFGGNGCGELGVALLVEGNFGEEFTASAGDSRSCRGSGLVLGCDAMREKGQGAKRENNCGRETTHEDLQGLVRGKRRGVYNEIEVAAKQNPGFIGMDLYPSRLRKNAGKYFVRGFRQKPGGRKKTRKPVLSGRFRPGLKPRPPEERNPFRQPQADQGLGKRREWNWSEAGRCSAK